MDIFERAASAWKIQSEEVRDALKDDQPRFDLEELGDQVCDQLEETERRLREDFIGRFAANFLLATEAITNRLTAAEGRESRLEERQQALQAEFENHLAKVKGTLAEAYGCQNEWVRWFHAYNEKYRDAVEGILEAQLETLSGAVTARQPRPPKLPGCVPLSPRTTRGGSSRREKGRERLYGANKARPD